MAERIVADPSQRTTMQALVAARAHALKSGRGLATLPRIRVVPRPVPGAGGVSPDPNADLILVASEAWGNLWGALFGPDPLDPDAEERPRSRSGRLFGMEFVDETVPAGEEG